MTPPEGTGQPPEGMVKITTKSCPECKDRAVLIVKTEEFKSHSRGNHVQVAYPNMTPENRERLVTGYCPSCWDELLGEDVT